MKTTQVLTSVILAVVAWLAPGRDAHAQGLLQVTFDRDSWPTEEVQRTIVLPAGMTQLQASFGYSGFDSGDFTSKTYALTPLVAYGLTPNITVGATYDPLVQSSTISSFDGTPSETSTDSTLSRGSVFAIARPFNSYDLGLRAAIPFYLDAPTVDVDLRLVGRLSVSLDTVSWFFSAGVIANVYNDYQAMEFEDDPFPTRYVADTYLACQLNSQLSLAPGLGFAFDGDHANGQLYGRAQFAIDHQIDLFGTLGFSFGHDGTNPLLVAGVNVWL